MSAPLSDERRQVIPRWRNVQQTIELGELRPALSVEAHEPTRDFLVDKVRDWESNRIWPFAAELVGAALVLNRPQDARDAAEFLLQQRSALPSQVLTVATKILDSNNPTPRLRQEIARDAIQGAIREAKLITRTDPGDALAWVEMSRNYAILGQTHAAARAMNVALALAPNHRYVLRSAVRLYTHIGEHSRAHDIVKRAERTPRDPWLLSAELASAAVAGKTSDFIKTARRLLESSNIHSFDKTELASALATVDANGGDLRRARRAFRQSLEAPNDNAVAQARWAASHSIIYLDPQILRLQQAYEARAWYAYYAGKWDLALKAGTRWLKDQPFSAGPAVQTSYIAAVALEDHNRALQALDIGKMANPRDPNILNNLSYSLACLGRLDEAEAALDKIDTAGLPVPLQAAILATTGLINYRRGDRKAGRLLYEQAIGTAMRSSNDRLAAKAALFLALEELLSSGDSALSLAEKAIKQSSPYKDADFEMLRLKLQKAVEQFTAAQ